jgi:CheY-like chemotaxis protein
MKQSHTILVVDDEPVNVLLLKRILELKNYTIITAASGTESLQIMQKTKPDLILLDLLMPGMNGFMVLDHIKNNHSTYDVPVIIISALYERENKEKALNAGALAYLIKPVTPKLILDTVGEIINNNNSGE